MTPTGCTMKDRVMMATVTGVVPSVGALLAAVVVWPEEAEPTWCVTTITKLGT